MSFEDDMIEYGFTDSNDYIDYLYNVADKIFERQEEQEHGWKEHEEWLESLSGEEIADWSKEKNDQKEDTFQKKQREIRQQRLDEELILKLWSKDNPQKARVYYAYYTNSPKLDNVYFEDFLKSLGTSLINGYGRKDLWDGYAGWKRWLERYEAYQEFKEKAPKEWEQMKIDKYREYIYNAAQVIFKYDQSIPSRDENRLIYEYRCEVGATFKAQKILNRWINAYPKLWNEISLKYRFVLKTDEDYLFQAWLETFQWDDTFTVWKTENISLWRQFQNRCIEGTVVEESELRSAWMETHKEEWRKWKQLQSELWKQFYENHKEFLWYAYTEEVWIKFVNETRIKNESERKIMNKKELTYDEDLNTVDYYDSESGLLEESLFDETKYDFDYFTDEANKLHDEKYENIEKEDPRFTYKCKTNEEEDKIHDILIAQYREDLSKNPDKALYLQQYCSECGFDAFVKRTKKKRYCGTEINIQIEESPEDFANRKILDLWIAKHKTQYQKWKYRYCWSKEYPNIIGYSKNDYYKVWKQLKAGKWNKWLVSNFKCWKQAAQNLDIWFAWLCDNNEWTFHQWASLHLRGWKRLMDEIMKWDYDSAFRSLFGWPCSDFNEWKKNSPKEWKYWKELIKEQILIDEYYVHNDITLPYHPLYYLHIQIKEKMYMHRIGKNVFHNHLAVIQDNEKYGYIDENGKIVIPIIYDEAKDFCDGLACVNINGKQMRYCVRYADGEASYGKSNAGGQWGIINTKGDFVVYPQYDYISPFKGNVAICSANGILKEKNMKYIRFFDYVDSKWGAINRKGEVVIPLIHKGLKLLEDGTYLAKVNNNYEKWGLLKDNKIDIVGEYDSIEALNNGMFKVNIGLKYKEIEDAFGEVFLGEYNEGKWGLLSAKGEQLTPLKYTHISNFHNGRALVNVNSEYDRLLKWSCKGGLWGYINEKGEEVMPLIECDDYLNFKDKIAW